ncbi:GDSL esterase lipase [Babesia ovata]|uniref:GDSL esterase lipase n=1 Tax=Babesia ovata TaxID=189622 RepID=A0A2H6KGX9_9APIC|nr:GDSL esterase lipase [Babesia ovata]GBE62260.1 GDSL esterase lipase [Babesia ovata]
MSDITTDRLERLKQNLLKLNYKKHKKRVGEARIHLTQYLAHVLPMASQRFLLAPIYRSCVASQGGNMTLYNMLRISHPTPLKILIGLYDSMGFKKLWSLSRVHILSGAIYPGVLIGSRIWVGDSVYPNGNGTLCYNYMRTVMLCNFAHLFSYPFDVAYGRFASTVARDVSIRQYLRETISKYGFARLYSGYTICATSTALHLMIALSLNNHLHGKLKERLSSQIERNPAYSSTIRPLEPRGMDNEAF